MLNKVTVDKSQLLTTLYENRDKHIEIVKEAKIGYIQDAKRVFQEKLTLVLDKNIVDINLNLTPPADHTKEYDIAISMLEWEKSAEVILEQQSFRNFVLDDWSWKTSFMVSNAKYSPIASGCAASMGWNV